MEYLEKEFHKLKIEVEKKEKQLKIEETKTALLKTDLEVKIKHYESLKVQKAILIKKRKVKNQAHEMETFLKNMPTNTDKKEGLKSEDNKLSMKLLKIQEIKGGSGLVGKPAVAYSGAINNVGPVHDGSEQDIDVEEMGLFKSNSSLAGEVQNCAPGHVSEAKKQINDVKECFKTNKSPEAQCPQTFPNKPARKPRHRGPGDENRSRKRAAEHQEKLRCLANQEGDIVHNRK